MADLIAGDLSDDDKNAWGTDPDVFNAMNNEFNFDLDAAANKINAKCDIYLTKDENALEQDWSSISSVMGVGSVWINPPYGRGFIKRFINKCIEQKNKGVTSVMLLPATLDAQWLPIQDISEIRIITGGRLSFYHPITHKKIAGNTKGSMFVIFRPSKMPCTVRLIDRDELING
jgi:phage N-6-adenine-methyltransferase